MWWKRLLPALKIITPKLTVATPEFDPRLVTFTEIVFATFTRGAVAVVMSALFQLGCPFESAQGWPDVDPVVAQVGKVKSVDCPAASASAPPTRTRPQPRALSQTPVAALKAVLRVRSVESMSSCFT